MITRIEKQRVLDNIKDKEVKMLVSNILDKAIRFDKTENPYCSSFLNINEFNTVKSILNHFNIRYYTFYGNKDLGFEPERARTDRKHRCSGAFVVSGAVFLVSKLA